MKTVLHAVVWEVLYKNRSTFFFLTGLLVIGILAAFAPFGTEWAQAVERWVIMSFLISMLVAFAPFTFAESNGGWRMNSMLTRWFALPIRTAPMVFLPFFIGALFLAGLVGSWMPILNRVAPGLDGVYFAAVLIVGLAVLNALAWTVPRKPLQFWIGAAILFPLIVIMALAPQDTPNTDQFRKGMLVPLGLTGVGFTFYSWFAAARNRCGAWGGELRLGLLWRLACGKTGMPSSISISSPWRAMLFSESLPGLRLLATSWMGLLLMLFVWISFLLNERRPDIAFGWRVLPLVGMGILPILAVVWMAVWGIFGATDPNSMFRARLSSFRATLPVSSGFITAQRVTTLFAGWCFVWMPLVLMSFAYTPEITGIPAENRAYIQTAIARLMAISAFLCIGALPLLLWGRFEGFGHFLLIAVSTWAVCWGLSGQFQPDEIFGWRRTALIALVGFKLVASSYAFSIGLRKGHITWRYPIAVISIWAAVAFALVWGLPTYTTYGVYGALITILILPLARIAWSPLALAANRHR